MSGDLVYGRSAEQWRDLVAETTEILEEVARQGLTMTYTELNSRLVGRTGGSVFDFSKGSERPALGKLLGEVSEESYAADKVMLSALVVGSDKEAFEPSGGFYALAQQNGWLRADATRDDRVLFWHGQLESTYKRYKRRRRVTR